MTVTVMLTLGLLLATLLLSVLIRYDPARWAVQLAAGFTAVIVAVLLSLQGSDNRSAQRLASWAAADRLLTAQITLRTDVGFVTTLQVPAAEARCVAQTLAAPGPVLVLRSGAKQARLNQPGMNVTTSGVPSLPALNGLNISPCQGETAIEMDAATYSTVTQALTTLAAARKRVTDQVAAARQQTADQAARQAQDSADRAASRSATLSYRTLNVTVQVTPEDAACLDLLGSGDTVTFVGDGGGQLKLSRARFPYTVRLPGDVPECQPATMMPGTARIGETNLQELRRAAIHFLSPDR